MTVVQEAQNGLHELLERIAYQLNVQQGEDDVGDLEAEEDIRENQPYNIVTLIAAKVPDILEITPTETHQFIHN